MPFKAHLGLLCSVHLNLIKCFNFSQVISNWQLIILFSQHCFILIYFFFLYYYPLQSKGIDSILNKQWVEHIKTPLRSILNFHLVLLVFNLCHMICLGFSLNIMKGEKNKKELESSCLLFHFLIQFFQMVTQSSWTLIIMFVLRAGVTHTTNINDPFLPGSYFATWYKVSLMKRNNTDDDDKRRQRRGLLQWEQKGWP